MLSKIFDLRIDFLLQELEVLCHELFIKAFQVNEFAHDLSHLRRFLLDLLFLGSDLLLQLAQGVAQAVKRGKRVSWLGCLDGVQYVDDFLVVLVDLGNL